MQAYRFARVAGIFWRIQASEWVRGPIRRFHARLHGKPCQICRTAPTGRSRILDPLRKSRVGARFSPRLFATRGLWAERQTSGTTGFSPSVGPDPAGCLWSSGVGRVWRQALTRWHTQTRRCFPVNPQSRAASFDEVVFWLNISGTVPGGSRYSPFKRSASC
jgi:hypothetical protein